MRCRLAQIYLVGPYKHDESIITNVSPGPYQIKGFPLLLMGLKTWISYRTQISCSKLSS